VPAMLEDLLDKLAASATSSTDKGTAFEHLIASYLRTAPEFAGRFEEVYLWQEWPGRGNQHDHGIDIVAKETLTNGWCAIQCKVLRVALRASNRHSLWIIQV
jgi:predicted helicase